MDSSLSNCFWKEGLKLIQHNVTNSKLVGLRKFRAFSGVSPSTCEKLWNLIDNKFNGSEIKHLLWCLLFLKTYGTEHVNASIVGVDEKTLRLWVWRFIDKLSNLAVVWFI